ncbi:MAG TPA: hypothetical protein VI248_13330 [Kineosporiaceae bacterium]
MHATSSPSRRRCQGGRPRLAATTRRTGALGLLAAALLAGCTSTPSPTADQAPTTPATGSPTGSGSPTATGSGTTSPAGSAAASGTGSTTAAAAAASSPRPGGTVTPATSAGRPAAGSSPTTTRPAAPTPRHTPAPLTVTDVANGTTVNLHVGQTLHVVLGGPDRAGSTYWRFGTPPSRLRDASVSTVAGPRTGQCARPGSGCGTVTLTGLAASPGTTTITASRASCGEALRCDAAQGSFRLTIVIS